MLKKGSSALKAAYLGSVIISLQVCRCAVPKRLRRRRNEQGNCDKYRSRAQTHDSSAEIKWTRHTPRMSTPLAAERLRSAAAGNYETVAAKVDGPSASTISAVRWTALLDDSLGHDCNG